MKIIFLLITLLVLEKSFSQKESSIKIKNDYADVYHLALIIYTPDGKSQTRVSNLEPGEEKEYFYPAGTEIFIATLEQESFAMKGNNIKATGAKPAFVLTADYREVKVMLSNVGSIGRVH